MRSFSRTLWISQAMIGSGNSVTMASSGLIEKRMTVVIRDHQHIGCEIEEVQRNEQVDAVGF